MDDIFSTANPRIEPVYYGIAAVIALFMGMILRRFKRQRRISSSRACAMLLLTEYLFLVFASTVFSRTRKAHFDYELIPFWSYGRILAGSRSLFWEDIFNVLMLMPLGILLPVAWKRTGSAKQVILMGFLISLTIEFLQLILKRGLFEFDDMFHNTIGVMIGYWLYQRIHKRQKTKKE